MFMGTPEFAISTMEALFEDGYDIDCVVTQPDKPKNRGHKMTHPPVYDFAEKRGIKIYQPATLKKDDFEEILNAQNPDIIIVTAYGKILPEYVLKFPEYGCINVHASLLPKYRGAAPIQRSIIDGETKTGITIMYMEKGLDTGDMILKEECDITSGDTYETLHDKLALLGKKAVKEAMKQIEKGNVSAEKQDDAKSSYAHTIDKTTALIDWNKTSNDVYNLIRGLYPVPKAFTHYNSKIMKITKAEVANLTSDSKCGQIVKTDKDAFYVACKGGTVLKVTKIQPEGKKEMNVRDYFAGNKILQGDVLGK